MRVIYLAMLFCCSLGVNVTFATPPSFPKEMPESASSKAELAAKNLTESNDFFAANKDKPGVVMLPSGLQYKVLKEGSGQKPNPKGYVTVNYQGTFLNGTVFDSTYSREPITFALNSLTPGWREALPLMNTGSKWILYVPPKLAYGERGVGSIIGPNQALIFEIELLNTYDTLEDEFKKEHEEEWEDVPNMATP